MRKFSSYGPVSKNSNYYVPRQALVDFACLQLIGETPDEGGHYITVWAPRQRGKTWIMREVMVQLRANDNFEVAILTMQSAKNVDTVEDVLKILVRNLRDWFRRDFPDVETVADLPLLFTEKHFSKPLILILDEFDAFGETSINQFANEFRDMYIRLANEIDKKSGEKSSLLHGLALIGVRAVLGIENVTGSPFNVQRSIHIPNLTIDEVREMFQWYKQESGQQVEPEVVERLFYEVQGQPGLTSWFGELLTETYNQAPDQPITMENFDYVFMWATSGLPNNNILNIISKAKQEPYKAMALELFKTDEKMAFRYDDTRLNFLYLNGAIDIEKTPAMLYAKFSSPFVQKRLFNYFANELFSYMGKLHDPLEDLDAIITEESLNIENLLKRYEQYLRQNREWLLKEAPRRADLRIYEAVYHFNLYMYLAEFLRNKKGEVYPEFPTGNGQIDLIIKYRGRVYGLEVKSFTDKFGYSEALQQAARYAARLGLTEVTLAFFIEAIDDDNRKKLEATYQESGLTVKPVFVVTGN